MVQFIAYAEYVCEQRSKSNDFFVDLSVPDKNSVNGYTLRPKDVINRDSDKEAIRLIRTIIEELQIMMHIIELQFRALRTLRHRHWYIARGFLGESKETLEVLVQQGKDVHEMVCLPSPRSPTREVSDHTDLITILTCLFLYE